MHYPSTMAAAVDMNLRWQDQKVVKVDRKWTVDGGGSRDSRRVLLIGASRPVSKVEPVYQHQPSNIPGMTYIGLKVTAPVGSATAPHRHGGAAGVATRIRGRGLN